MCEDISKAKIFNNRKLRIHNGSPIYIECLTLFLTTSIHRVWLKLYLSYIQDYGCHIIHRGLKGSGITITELWLSAAGLTYLSSKLVSDIVINCNVKKLVLDGNKSIGENEQLYSMLSYPSTTLEVLSMYKTKLSSRAANILFTTLEHNNTLKILSIEDNDITDETCPFIANVIKLNNCLEKLWMRFNPISPESIKLILQAMQFNNTLDTLRIPDYLDHVKINIILTEENINKLRESQGIHVKLSIDFNTRIQSLPHYLT